MYVSPSTYPDLGAGTTATSNVPIFSMYITLRKKQAEKKQYSVAVTAYLVYPTQIQSLDFSHQSSLLHPNSYRYQEQKCGFYCLCCRYCL